MTNDTISRQAAIEVIDAVFPVDPMKSEYAQGIACGAALAKTYVEQLPSAQPEPSEIARDTATIIENERDMRVVLENSEPCEDAVSRQRLLSDLKELVAAWKKYPVMAEQIKGVEVAIGYVETIPSVKPDSKELSLTQKTLDNDLPSAQPQSCEDCISRQAAIDAIRKEYGGIKNANMDGDFLADEIEFILSKLPSAQPEPSQVARDIATIIENEKDMRVIAQPSFSRCHEKDNVAEVGKKGDTIYRADAIDFIEERISANGYSNTALIAELNRCIGCLMRLPSAQPEQRWITSGKPMNSGMYLVTLRQKFEGEEAYGVRIMRFINGNWMLPKHFPEWINEEIEQEVLAWMPLPEPYKDDPCNGCDYLGESCVGEGCGKLTERKEGEADD